MFHQEITDDYIKKNKGKVLGRGVHRVCYEHKNDKSLVFKKAKGTAGIMNNTIEWCISCYDINGNLNNKIAKVISISGDGIRVIQERCEQVTEMPERIFKCLKFDCKKENFGMLNGELVKLDYGSVEHVYNALLSDTTILYPFREK